MQAWALERPLSYLNPTRTVLCVHVSLARIGFAILVWLDPDECLIDFVRLQHSGYCVSGRGGFVLGVRWLVLLVLAFLSALAEALGLLVQLLLAILVLLLHLLLPLGVKTV